jgi:ABC-2 type transport system permease protein
VTGLSAVVYRDWRQRMTNVGFVFWDVVVPLAYLLLFGTGFDRMLPASMIVEGQPLSYMAFLLPGVIAMTAFSVAMNTAWGFFMDKDSGIFYELLTYPITRRQLLVGKGCFNIVLGTAGSLLAIALGVFGLGVRVQWSLMPLTIVVVMVTTAGWFFLLSIFAIRLRRMDSFNTITSAAYIFLMFMSPLFYPIAELPGWFRWTAYANPMTWQVDLLRFGLLGIGSANVILLEALGVAIFTALCLTLAARALDRAA